MKRILVLGGPASGKSTLTRRLASITGLPVVHLDRIHWRSGWKETSEAEFLSQLAIELEKGAWIIDGNYGKTIALRLRSADTAILLDFPRWRCLWRAVTRSIVGWGKSRPDMADGCREKLDPEFFLFVWRYQAHSRPRLLAELDRFTGEKVLLRTPAEVTHFLHTLRSLPVSQDTGAEQ